MSNMSYCRFQNTASDLDDCKDAIGRMMHREEEDRGDGPEHLSQDEKRAAVRLLRTCLDVVLLVAEHGEMDLDDLAGELEPEETLVNSLKALMAEADGDHAAWKEERR